MPRLQRTYDLTLETLTPVHISLGPEEVLIPAEECDTDGSVTWVLDRPALIADLLAAPPPPPAPPAATRRTYQDMLTDERIPVFQRQLILQAMRASGAGPDAPAPAYLLGEDEEEVTPPPAAPTTAAWSAPRDLPPGEKRWRTAAGADLVRYVLDGTPQVPGQPAGAWWEAISRLPRAVDGAILLPASGIKGAVRSVLAWAMAERLGAERLAAPNAGIPRFAAQPMERQTLAPEAARNAPNYDAGRLLRTHDATGDARARIAPFGILTASQWRIFQGGAREGAAAVEMIPAGSVFHTRLTVDTFLLERWVDERRGADGGGGARVPVFAAFREVLGADLGPLLEAGRRFARAVLEKDRRFYAEAAPPGTRMERPRAAIAGALEGLDGLQPNQTLLQLGWGTGRAGKTPYRMAIAEWLAAQPAEALDAAQRALLASAGGARSRRLTVGEDGAPDRPFGWVRCTVTPRAERGDQ